jgi:hypothetical protein
LEGRSSTIELRPQGLNKYYHTPKNAQFEEVDFATVRSFCSENGASAVKLQYFLQ